MPKIINLQQNTEEWLQWRRSKIGSSDAGIILGISPYCTPFTLWQRKLGLIAEQEEHAGMRRGKELEKEALLRYMFETGHIVRSDIIQSDKQEFMIASMDGISPCLTKACEVKCLNEEDHLNGAKGIILPIYYAQMQAAMYVCNLKEMDYVGYSRGCDIEFYMHTLDRNEEFLADYLPKAKAFWECVQNFTAPELLPRDYRDMSQNPDYRAAEAAYVDICDKIDRLEEQKERMKLNMLSMSEGMNIQGAYTRLTNYVRKGAIEYSKIPQLSSVDLEQYRKPVIKSVRITKV